MNTGDAWAHFHVEIREFVATVAIRRPPLNTLGTEALRELSRILDRLEPDDNVRVILLTGEGDKAFSAGADITEFGRLDGGPEEAVRRGQALFTRVERFPKPVIAVLNGLALGGGCELMLACHLAFASDRAEIGLPEVRLGLVPGYGGTQRLARMVGRRRALQLLLSGMRVQAYEALDIGLVNEIFPHDRLREFAFERAAELARNSAPLAMRGILRAVHRGLDLPLEEGLSAEREEVLGVLSTEDLAEGIQAFFEKREPRFNGR